jgi:hypothetical protein
MVMDLHSYALSRGRPFVGRAALAALFAACFCASSPAQTVFSIEYRDPTIALPDGCKMIPITEGDLLTPNSLTGIGKPAFGPLGTPCIWMTGGIGGLGLPMHTGCVGHPPGVPCGVEVDAVSFGTDGPALPAMPPGAWWFSVDPWATGIAGTMSPPAVWTEAMPIGEACADAFVDLGLPAGPLPPFAIAPANTAVVDGNGMRGTSPFLYQGVGLIEPAPPVPPPFATLGDNLDALDFDGPKGSNFVFFSLDAGFTDPLTGFPYSNSAIKNGFLPAMVLRVSPLTPIMVYALPAALGLDFAGSGTDDLDALALYENGIAGFQPSTSPYGWLAGTDMLLFSVRRGSAVIGRPDSAFDIPIEPGDILMPPIPGGMSPFPAIFIAAENVGLATSRATGVAFGDELDALDVALQPLFDCNANAIEDAVDIELGTSLDVNDNRVPDECESATTTYCTAKVNSLGCTPAIGYAGLPSVNSPASFDITAVNILNNKWGLFFYSLAGKQALPFQGGWLCTKLPIRRTASQFSGGTPPPVKDCSGTYTLDFNARIDSGVDPALVQGAWVWGQYWYRDPGFAPPKATGLTDAIEFVIAY